MHNNPDTHIAVQRNIERLLNTFSQDKELFAHNDILFFKGSQAALFHRGGKSEWHTLSQATQVIGTFKSICVLEAPLQRLVLEDIHTKDIGDRPNLLSKTASTPAIRIINPMLVINGDAVPQEDVMIDIPLLYKNVSFERFAKNQTDGTLDS